MVLAVEERERRGERGGEGERRLSVGCGCVRVLFFSLSFFFFGREKKWSE